MSFKTVKTIVLLCIFIGIHQTVRVSLHQGLYTIQDSNLKVPNLDKLKVNLDNERISIQGGCNVQSAGYTIKNGLITYTPWISTLKFCLDDHDSEVVKAFEGAAKISAFAGKVYLYNKNGEKVMKLKKIE